MARLRVLNKIRKNQNARDIAGVLIFDYNVLTK